MSDLLKIKEQIQHLKVLFVDDEESILKDSELFLKKFFHTVVLAKNGVQALQIAQETSFDIVMTDILMPKMSGIELAKKIRVLDPSIYIVFISAFTEEVDKTLYDSYIYKPFEYNNLIELLSKIAINCTQSHESE